MDLKGKAVDVASETLKAGGTSDNLQNNNDSQNNQMLSAAGGLAMDMAGNAIRDSSKGSHKQQASNQEIANNVLVNGNASNLNVGNSTEHYGGTPRETQESGSHSRRSNHRTGDSQQFGSGSGGRRFASGGGFSGADYNSSSGGSTAHSDGSSNFKLTSGTKTERFSASSSVERLDSRDTRQRLSSRKAVERLRTGEDAERLSIHDKAGVRLVSDSEGGDKLYTASKRRKHAAALRDGQSNELKHYESNENKLRANNKKLQKKLRQEYETKNKLKGGLVTDLRVEEKAESKLYGAPKLSGAEAAGSFGRKMLHVTDDMARDDEGLGIQNAWVDTGSRVLDTSSRVYSLSQTAKYHRMAKNEAQIAKLARQQDKIMKNQFRLQYRSALKTARDSELWANSNLYERHLQKNAIKRRYMKNAIKQYQNAKRAGATGRVAYNTGFNVVDKAKEGIATVAENLKRLFSSPMGRIALVVILVIGLVFSLVGAAGPILLMSFGGDENFTKSQMTGAGFPAEVEQWRAFVTERMTEYNYPDFVNAILATIQQESGGVSESCGGDLMQDKASGYWESGTPSGWSSYTTEQKSIDAGCRYFITGLESWGVTEADDYDGLQIVAQGYNYGYGFHTYMKDQNATKWTLTLSTNYSNQQAAKLGWSSYGHKEYGEEWLAKYQAGGVGGGAVVEKKGPEGVMQTAQNQIGIAEQPVNDVIFNTDYYGAPVNGDDYPWCCAFVWWVFNKSGNADAFYNGGKTASCSTVYSWAQSNGYFISGSEAQYGDIVLFGSNEHIELVVSKNADGSYTTIGGNTSSDVAGSQSNGGCVALKTRYTSGSFPITSFIRPPYSE